MNLVILLHEFELTLSIKNEKPMIHYNKKHPVRSCTGCCHFYY